MVNECKEGVVVVAHDKGAGLIARGNYVASMEAGQLPGQTARRGPEDASLGAGG